jgi:hypothetical protein
LVTIVASRATGAIDFTKSRAVAADAGGWNLALELGAAWPASSDRYNNWLRLLRLLLRLLIVLLRLLRLLLRPLVLLPLLVIDWISLIGTV